MNPKTPVPCLVEFPDLCRIPLPGMNKLYDLQQSGSQLWASECMHGMRTWAYQVFRGFGMKAEGFIWPSFRDSGSNLWRLGIRLGFRGRGLSPETCCGKGMSLSSKNPEVEAASQSWSFPFGAVEKVNALGMDALESGCAGSGGRRAAPPEM